MPYENDSSPEAPVGTLRLPEPLSSERALAHLHAWAPNLSADVLDEAEISSRWTQVSVNLFRNQDEIDVKRRVLYARDRADVVYDDEREPYDRLRDAPPGEGFEELWVQRAGQVEFDCNECDTDGRVHCEVCAGQGSVICDAFLPCQSCRGTGTLGERSCSACRGDGQTRIPGGGRERWWACDGVGRPYCRLCYGTRTLTAADSARIKRDVLTALFEATVPAGSRRAPVQAGEWEFVFDGDVGADPPSGLPPALDEKVRAALAKSLGESSRRLTVWATAVTTASYRRRGMKRTVTIIGDGVRIIGRSPGTLF